MSSASNVMEQKHKTSVVEQKRLSDCAGALAKFSSSRSPSELYTKMQLFSVDGILHLQAQNNSGVAVVNTGLTADISCIVDYAAFHGTVSRITDEVIELSVNGPRLIVKSERTEVKIPTHDFVSPTIGVASPEATVEPEQWIEGAGRMSLAGSETQVEYASGVRLFSEPNKLYMLMSSSSGMCGYLLDGHTAGAIDIVVPLESVKAAAMAIRRSGGDSVSLGYHNNWLYIECGNFRAMMPSIGGKLPHTRSAWERVKPTNELIIPRQELIDGLKQAELFSGTGACGVDIIPMGDGLKIVRGSVNDEGVNILDVPGECEYIIPGHFSGDALIIRLPYLLQMLSCCTDEYRIYTSNKSVCVESGRYFAGFSCMTRGQK